MKNFPSKVPRQVEILLGAFRGKIVGDKNE